MAEFLHPDVFHPRPYRPFVIFSLHLAKTSLKQCLWYIHADQGDNADKSPQSHSSLYIDHFKAHMLILCHPPPIVDNTQLDHVQSSVATVLQASPWPMHTIVKFVRGLVASGPPTRGIASATPGCLGYMLCLQKKEPNMLAYDQGLLAAWRTMLRTRVQSWPLLRFAVVKVDVLFWKKLDHLA